MYKQASLGEKRYLFSVQPGLAFLLGVIDGNKAMQYV